MSNVAPPGSERKGSANTRRNQAIEVGEHKDCLKYQ